MSRIKFTEHQKKYINPNARKWVQMVYNDDLLQTKDQLEDDSHGFCCLGVGALCYQMNTGEELPLTSDGAYDHYSLAGDFNEVRSWLGLIGSMGNVSCSMFGHSALSTLTSMNDHGNTFKEIAQVMLDYPEAYFLPVEKQVYEK